MHFTETKETLNQLVADLSQFATVIHQTHWYMRGAEFLHLHPLMDKLMDEINDQLDVVAERLITLDGAPYSTLGEFSQNTVITDMPGTYDLELNTRLARLVDGYRLLANQYQHGIIVSGDEGDTVTQDIMIGFKGAIEKRIWMLQAELSAAPDIDAE